MGLSTGASGGGLEVGDSDGVISGEGLASGDADGDGLDVGAGESLGLDIGVGDGVGDEIGVSLGIGVDVGIGVGDKLGCEEPHAPCSLTIAPLCIFMQYGCLVTSS